MAAGSAACSTGGSSSPHLAPTPSCSQCAPNVSWRPSLSIQAGHGCQVGAGSRTRALNAFIGRASHLGEI
eukprot:4773530-Pyramimonas_sp.AAC.1